MSAASARTAGRRLAAALRAARAARRRRLAAPSCAAAQLVRQGCVFVLSTWCLMQSGDRCVLFESLCVSGLASMSPAALSGNDDALASLVAEAHAMPPVFCLRCVEIECLILECLQADVETWSLGN